MVFAPTFRIALKLASRLTHGTWNYTTLMHNFRTSKVESGSASLFPPKMEKGCPSLNETCPALHLCQGKFVHQSVRTYRTHRGVLVSFTSTEKMWEILSENQHLSHILSTCYQCSSHNIPTPTYYQLFNHFISINYQLLNKFSSFSPLGNQHSIKRSTISPHFIKRNVAAFWKM